MKHGAMFGFAVAIAIGIALATACGGKEMPPAESPEAAPEALPPATSPEEPMDGGTEGTHTMPDGAVMPGHEHHEH